MRGRLVVCAIAVLFAAFTLYKRHHTASDETVGCRECEARAACFARENISSGKEEDVCWSLMSDCEEARSYAVRDLDHNVGGCRVVSLTKGDREAYELYVMIAWLLGGVAFLIVAGPLTRRIVEGFVRDR